MGKDPRDAAMDLVIADRGETSVIISIMREDDVRLALANPMISIGTDSGARAEDGPFSESKSHPRAWGSFPRVLGKYVRDEKLITLEDAVRRFTSRPAARVGIADRGLLRPGMKADITIFDPATIRDVSTFVDPTHYSVGIPHVLVNGKAVVSNGKITAERPGQPIRGPGYKAIARQPRSARDRGLVASRLRGCTEPCERPSASQPGAARDPHHAPHFGGAVGAVGGAGHHRRAPARPRRADLPDRHAHWRRPAPVARGILRPVLRGAAEGCGLLGERRARLPDVRRPRRARNQARGVAARLAQARSEGALRPRVGRARRRLPGARAAVPAPGGHRPEGRARAVRDPLRAQRRDRPRAGHVRSHRAGRALDGRALGWRRPSRRACAAMRIPIAARIIGLAQVVEIFWGVAGPERALEMAAAAARPVVRSGAGGLPAGRSRVPRCGPRSSRRTSTRRWRRPNPPSAPSTPPTSGSIRSRPRSRG